MHYIYYLPSNWYKTCLKLSKFREIMQAISLYIFFFNLLILKDFLVSNYSLELVNVFQEYNTINIDSRKKYKRNCQYSLLHNIKQIQNKSCYILTPI